MTEEEAFRKAIVENRADDTVRLVYADWLEESPKQLPCTNPKCIDGQHHWEDETDWGTPISRSYECKTCKGKGFLDTENELKAWFMRTSVAARNGGTRDYYCTGWMYSCGENIPTYAELAKSGCANCKKWAFLILTGYRLFPELYPDGID